MLLLMSIVDALFPQLCSIALTILLSGASVALITSLVPQHGSAVYFRGIQWPFYPALSPDIGRNRMWIQLGCSQAAFPIIVIQLCFPSMYIWVLSGATSELLLSSVPQSFANCEISGCVPTDVIPNLIVHRLHVISNNHF